jgi:RNA polymerase sigma-70 factor (ECF subfamily)
MFVRHISSFEKEDIEDILQESFIKAYRNLNDLDKNLSFSSWIYQITRNTTIDAFRKKIVRPQFNGLEDHEIVNLFVSGMDLQEDAIVKEQVHQLRLFITSLPHQQREILILRYLEEKTYEEIMDILELPKGTVAARINRAKKILLAHARKQRIIDLNT